MSISENRIATNSFIPQSEEKEFKIISLMLDIFDYDMESIANQIVNGSPFLKQAAIKYGNNTIKDSFMNACIKKSTYKKELIKEQDEEKEVEIEIISYQNWTEAAKLFIENLKADKNSGIYWFAKTIEHILNFCPKGITIGIEFQYVDRIYRDSYYIHLGEEHFNKSRFCKRIIIFRDNQCSTIINVSLDSIKKLQDNFIGSMVIRPLKNKPIGRCLLNPFYFRKTAESKIYVRVSEYNISYCGIRLSIQAFPFEMQDGVTTTCAEVTLLNLLDYYSNKFQDYRFAVPSSLNKVTEKLSVDRIRPATGLSYENISKILCETGFTPKFYRTLYNMQENEIIQIMSFYIESGIPIALGLNKDEKDRKRGHSVVCIGHGEVSNERIKAFVIENTPKDSKIRSHKNKNNKSLFEDQTVVCKKTIDDKIKILHRTFAYTAINQYIIQDDLNEPYHIMMPVVENGSLIDSNNNDIWYINCLVAPLYKRMYMDAAQARKVIDQILVSKIGPINKGTSIDNCIVVRLFLASSRNLKEYRVMTIQNLSVRNLYQRTPCPQFVWVAELYDIENYPNEDAFGEIVLDATNAEGIGLDSVIMINYNSRHLARDRDGLNITQETKPDDPNTIQTTFYLGDFDFAVFTDIDKCTYKPYNHNLFKFPDN